MSAIIQEVEAYAIQEAMTLLIGKLATSPYVTKYAPLIKELAVALEGLAAAAGSTTTTTTTTVPTPIAPVSPVLPSN